MGTVKIMPKHDVPLMGGDKYHYDILGVVMINDLQIEISCNTSAINKSIKVTPYGINGETTISKEIQLKSTNFHEDFASTTIMRPWQVTYLLIESLGNEDFSIEVGINSIFDERTHSISSVSNNIQKSTSSQQKKNTSKKNLYHVGFLSEPANKFKGIIDGILKNDFIEEDISKRPVYKNWNVGFSENGNIPFNRQRAFYWDVKTKGVTFELYNHYLDIGMIPVSHEGIVKDRVKYLHIFYVK